MSLFDPTDPLSPVFGRAVGAALREFLDQHRNGTAADELIDLAQPLVSGGKRLRPAFCAWGYLAVAPEPADPSELIRVAASLDLLHVSALVHDDVMDAAATRRGQPTVHVVLAASHRERGWRGDPDAFGRAGAIVLGNLLAAWSVELCAHLPPRADRGLLAAVRTDVNVGQYLDALAQSRDPLDARCDPEGMMAVVREVVEAKTALYTVTRPLQIGAALALSRAASPGAPAGDANVDAQARPCDPSRLLDGLATFGTLLGRAFQFRDDLLGVFGDPATTGKPAGDDLREGKMTALVVRTMELADAADAARLAGLLGKPDLSPDETDEAREIIRFCGADAAVEADIAAARAKALDVLDALGVRAEARTALAVLADLVTDRVA